MNKSEIVAFLNANPVCFLATVDGSAARVRGMMMYRADGTGLLFHSGSGKDVCRQLAANPNVEVCFFDPKSNTQVRVSGRAEFVTDEALKDKIIEERPFLKPIVAQFGRGSLAVFRVAAPVATVWTMAENMAPKRFVTL
jgi:pyridoxamine 5'-phosphate oxidase